MQNNLITLNASFAGKVTTRDTYQRILEDGLLVVQWKTTKYQNIFIQNL